ncbi:MAG: UDP-4-amino-4,6-dideoxy-N-acetyl-beta-L-altrosamine transaminase [Deltaproteobacteria bacterium]|nr:UDP-4-amino-4,6-dideoxy-N-acetyl-beta-L-altrosamine transaminase [Deltaproteobacteria bacterium]
MTDTFIPYGRHFLDSSDIAAVDEVLRSDWLTTGSKVDVFESAVADYVGADYGVAVSSGTAALHCALVAAGVGDEDEVLMPALTFVADASMVALSGARPVLADVKHEDLLIDVNAVADKISPRTKALIAVDYAGQPCDYIFLRRFADRHNLCLIADACHALGSSQDGRKVGSLADMTVFSFHPVKHITTGEGGMVVTDKAEFAEKIRKFRNHGISVDHQQRAQRATWEYDVETFAFNYRLTDFQCALGLSQLKKLPIWLVRRREIARRYDLAFKNSPYLKPLHVNDAGGHAYHLYVVRLNLEVLSIDKAEIFKRLRQAGIGVNVHYKPLNLMTVMQRKYGYLAGDFPVAEKAYEEILSLPIYPAMQDEDVQKVADSCLHILSSVK